MAIFKNFYIPCRRCGHRNRPAHSPREGIRLALLGQAGICRGCGKILQPVIPDRPLAHKVRAELIAEGLAPCAIGTAAVPVLLRQQPEADDRWPVE